MGADYSFEVKNIELWVLTFFKHDNSSVATMPEHIYNPITAMGFLAMFTFQLDNTKG